MLSERVFEEMTRDTPFRQHLVEMAWSSLSVEAKLQVIQTVQIEGTRATPAWLTDLALADTAPVVRYWAARHTYFVADLNKFSFMGATEDDVVRHKKATEDSCELVRLCAEKDNTLTYETLTQRTHLHRLAFIRNLRVASLGPFIRWLIKAVDAGLPDAELRDFTLEFFALFRHQRELSRKGYDFIAYSASDDQDDQCMQLGWEITKKAGRELQRALSEGLPLRWGFSEMRAEELVQLPAGVIESLLLCRTKDSPEVERLADMVRKRPEQFHEDVIVSLKTYDEVMEFTDDLSQEMEADYRLHSMPSQQEAILETVLELRHKLDDLRQTVNAVPGSRNDSQ